MKKIIVSKEADKVLQKMQPKRKQAIVAKINAYARGERVDIKKLVGSDLYRIRVGQDRIIIDDNGIIVFIVEVGPRGGIYKE
ncbi:type II toxin-antitoxin system RelE/ParE family toxin [Rhizobium sp. L1K21]|uniref:type II toxin-antitoxin system RelE family toxin n=1 Tax=Rhizobium sp. L1K21 TaxID=2954933 RepID=UPI00209296C3|nr:cytotoxic translational repressor of toxin-antitoxin stability system [Rhizobium sp. L1K21]MCO6186758.1 cytotoxic translational repressor of toxin-antitoxin stability system [Rhizobium sp. L1K21]